MYGLAYSLYGECRRQAHRFAQHFSWHIQLYTIPTRFPRIEGASGNVSGHHTSRSTWISSRTALLIPTLTSRDIWQAETIKKEVLFLCSISASFYFPLQCDKSHSYVMWPVMWSVKEQAESEVEIMHLVYMYIFWVAYYIQTAGAVVLLSLQKILTTGNYSSWIYYFITVTCHSNSAVYL